MPHGLDWQLGQEVGQVRWGDSQEPCSLPLPVFRRIGSEGLKLICPTLSGALASTWGAPTWAATPPFVLELAVELPAVGLEVARLPTMVAGQPSIVATTWHLATWGTPLGCPAALGSPQFYGRGAIMPPTSLYCWESGVVMRGLVHNLL